MLGMDMSRWLLRTEALREQWLGAFHALQFGEKKKEFKEILVWNGQGFAVSAFVPFSGYLALLFRKSDSVQGSSAAAVSGPHLTLPLGTTDNSLAQRIHDLSPSAILSFRARPDPEAGAVFELQSANPAAFSAFAGSAESAVGATPTVLWPGTGAREMVKVFHRVLQTGEPERFPAGKASEDGNNSGRPYRVFRLSHDEIGLVAEEEVWAQAAPCPDDPTLKAVLEEAGAAVLTFSHEGATETLNTAAEHLTGWIADEAKGKPLREVFDIFHEITGMRCKDPVESVLRHGQPVSLFAHTALRSRAGNERAIAGRAVPILDAEGETAGVVLLFRDISEDRDQRSRISFLSNRDALTGLYSRAWLENALSRLDGSRQHPLALVLGDLDRLRQLNDAFGYPAGDEALVKVAGILEANCREGDLVARWGGDEFAMLLPNAAEYAVQNLCEKVKTACVATRVAGTTLSLSMGYAIKPDAGVDWRDVLQQAESALARSRHYSGYEHHRDLSWMPREGQHETDAETEAHSLRVARYCRGMGEAMGLSPMEVDELELIARLHDIGKTCLEDEIRNKPAQLSDAETEQMRKHPEIGYRILRIIPGFAGVAEGVLAHHERWDGTGYPRGLFGENIPLLARILAVADAYDAMTQDRPYRKALLSTAAMDELSANAGTQFDPRVVDAFQMYLRKTRE